MWANALEQLPEAVHQTTGSAVAELRRHPDNYALFADRFTKFRKITEEEQGHEDLAEDCTAWQELKSNIAHTIDASAGLDQFLQQLDLRSKGTESTSR